MQVDKKNQLATLINIHKLIACNNNRELTNVRKHFYSVSKVIKYVPHNKLERDTVIQQYKDVGFP